MSKISFLVGVSALFLALPSFASVSTADELFAYMQKQNPKGKADVLASMPEELKSNFVLVRNSRSRQMGTPQLPRVVHFTKSTDLVVTSSGHDYSEDHAGLDLEVMELDKQTGRWIFSTISFDKSGLMGVKKNIPMCTHCHGSIPRPIWGDYPRWPFAYGGSTAKPEVMDGQELADFTAFAASASSHEGYAHLKFKVLADRYDLVGTVYGLPNSVFTARLGVRTAVALYTRASHAPDFARNSAAFAAYALTCKVPSTVVKRIDASYAARVKTDAAFAKRWSGSAVPKDAMSLVVRLMDLDPTVDFELAEFPARSMKRESLDLTNPWNQGSDYLHSLLAFQTFYEIWKTDADLQRAFVAVSSTIETLAADSFGATNDRLLALDSRTSQKEYMTGLLPGLHFNVWDDATKGEAACDAFVKRAM